MAYITINRQHFYHNLHQIALKTGSVDKIAIVLKDNAYGHGLELMAKLSYEFGIKHAVVRDNLEANRVKHLFKSVLVLGGEVEIDTICSFAINSIEDIKRAPKGVKVELKVDTGMHRNGIALDELDEALALITKYKLELVGVMTHYRSADILSSELFWQQKRFDEVKSRVYEAGFKDIRVHSHNSATILRVKSFSEDLVRVGIGAYGYNELPLPFDRVYLKPVMKLYAKRVSTRVLRAGEQIGYGGDFRALQDMRVSTYDLGYGDGWCRGNTQQPYITSEGLSILGRVSMDYITLESEQEEVCIMSDAQDSAKQFNTISYEITTALSPKIDRIVV
jgi:alanine racemase